MAGRKDELAGFVREQATRWKVPGCAVAIVAGTAEPVVVTAGVTDVRSGEPVTTATLFRLGSVTKVLTATLVMRAVEEGLIRLDDRVIDRLPAFRLQDAAATGAVTIRHLLTKTDGIYDHVRGFGDSDDAVARYVASLSEVGQVAAPGELYSYSNSGAIVAARILEVVYGAPFDRLLADRLLRPLRLDATAHIVGNADLDPPGPSSINGRALATRHTHDARLEPVAGGPGDPPALDQPRAMAACGTTLAATIGDAIRLASSYLPGGDAILDSASLDEMARLQVQLPALDFGSGLGWFAAPSRPWVLRHNGGSRPPGTFAQLTIAPGHGIAIAVLANATTGSMLANALTDRVLDDNGVPQSQPQPTGEPAEPRACVGTYQRGHARFTVTANRDGSLDIVVRPGPLGDQDPKVNAAGTYHDERGPWFHGPGGRLAFIGGEGNREHPYLHDGRAARRIE